MRLEADKKSSFTITYNCPFTSSISKSQGGVVAKVQGVGHEGIQPKLNAELLVKVVKDAGLRLDLEAPSSNYPSMTSALQDFLQKKHK